MLYDDTTTMQCNEIRSAFHHFHSLLFSRAYYYCWALEFNLIKLSCLFFSFVSCAVVIRFNTRIESFLEMAAICLCTMYVSVKRSCSFVMLVSSYSLSRSIHLSKKKMREIGRSSMRQCNPSSTKPSKRLLNCESTSIEFEMSQTWLVVVVRAGWLFGRC